MGSYYYISDKDSDLGLTPVPEDEYMQAIFRIAKRYGLKITDEMILKELEKQNTKTSLTKTIETDSIILLKSPALAC